MRNKILTSLFALGMWQAAWCDVYIYNTVDERMRYEIVQPNGDTKEGTIAEYAGYYPTQTTLSTPEGQVTTFKVYSESGESGIEVKAPYSRCYLIGKKDGSLKFEPVSWSLDNGQTQERAMVLYNATGTAQTFDLIDEKEMRKLTLGPGEKVKVPATHGFGGSSGFHHLKFADGSRLENQISAGYFVILYLDTRNPGKVQAANYGHLAAPKGISQP